MKKMIFKRSKSGFTLAELLMVIAILVILIGLGVTGFFALRRKIQIAKYDDLAREIYVAVQNQLTRLDANGMDDQTVNTLKGTARLSGGQPEDYDENDWAVEQENFHYANQSGAQVMELLLPLGAVADDVRSNGFYAIEYNAKTNTVYGVFYSEKSFDYSAVSVMEGFRKSRDVRKDPMVGYYGGSSVKRDEQVRLAPPKLEIINTNELRLNILDVPTDAGLTVSVRISDGTNVMDVPVGENPGQLAFEGTNRTVLMDSILEPNAHFHELFKDLIPGKDLTITVTYSMEGRISSSASITANSLFATREEEPDGTATVTLEWARHLQNLESAFSKLDYANDNISIARQTAHIQWEDRFGQFISIQNENTGKLQSYEGSNLEIRDLTAANGLFAVTGENVTLSGIRLVNPQIDAPAGTAQSVGALVGSANGSGIYSCGVYYNKINSSDHTVDYDAYTACGITNSAGTYTGGLVGTATNVTVRNSFAALPGIQAQKGAALIGNASGCTIENSYANCDNLPESGFQYFITGTGNTVTHCYAVGNVANDHDGIFAAPGNTVTDSYYAVSHRKFAEKWEDNKDLSTTEFRYIRSGGWRETDQNGMAENPLGTGWSTGLIAPLSHPYREYLDGRGFPYPAIGELDHYGSWPDSDGTVDLKITMQLPNNKEAGYAVFAGTVIVKTVEQDGTETILFDSREHKDSHGNFDGIDTVKVSPGTLITVEIADAQGYQYISTQIVDKIYRDKKLSYTVKRDTEVIVNFQQSTFKLTCAQPVKGNGYIIAGATYLAVLGDSRVVRAPGVDDKVETGTIVTVQLELPTNMKAGVVWYTLDEDKTQERHILVPNAQGNYAFPMPSADTSIHVQYTDQVAEFHVEYYVMDPEADPAASGSKYPDTPTSTADIQYAIGTVITQDVINTLADNSGRLLTIEGTKVLYLDRAELYKEENGNLKQKTVPYDTSTDSNGDRFTVKIMIARKKSTVTLVAGENIQGVSFKGIEGTADPKTTSVTYYYGKKLTAVAQVAPGQNFTTWEPDTGLFRASSSVENAIEVPYFDVTLTARANAGFYQVTLDLLENEESWLAGSQSRTADPIRVTLVSTKDPKVTYEMRIPDPRAEEISYIAEAVVKSVPDIGEGYYIEVSYASGLSEYVKNADGSDRIVKVRDRPVEEDVHFFTVTYFPNLEVYRGTVPQGGTYLQFHELTVPGNVGHLRNDETDAKLFTGWYDAGVESIEREEVAVGQLYTVTRRTDFFARWQKNLRVRYDANDGVDADDPDQTFAAAGELPVDITGYVNGQTVKVKAGSLTRNGYTFLGWSQDKSAATAAYQPGDTFVIGENNVTLYAVWKWDEYTLTFMNIDGTELQTVSGKHYGDQVNAPVCVATDGEAFLGWATEPGGDVVYPASAKIPVTGNQTFYPRFDMETVDVTYHYGTNNAVTKTVKVGKGISFYLICDGAGDITAWRTEDSTRFYLCEEGSARSLEPAVFTGNIDLYAVTGRVYNFNRQLWYNTLYDAVNAANGDDTLIVYRNTQETKKIEFAKNLYVLANGNRTVTWEGAADKKLSEENEFVGCMYVHGTVDSPCTVEFGRSNIAALTMNGTLTFNAAKKSRVMALGAGARFYMYDGITFTNGYRKPADNPTGWNSDNVIGDGNSGRRSYFGGGVYAGLDSEFYMRGGTISYCSAYRGGGVYLYGNRNENKGSKMYMGEMARPTAYSATATYYSKQDAYYINQTGVTVENYRDYYVAKGNPEICYNTALQVKITCKENTDEGFSYADGGGGLLMLDLPDGNLELYRGSIHNNEAYANGGGIMTDGGGKVNGVDVGNEAELRIYEVDISHNKAGGFGGGIFQWQGIIHIYNSTLRQNYASECGGGIFLHHFGDENSDVNFYFGDIADNEARRDGGGVYVEKGLEMMIDGGNLRGNIAGMSGGGVYLAGERNGVYSKLNLSSGAIYDNTANHINPDGNSEKPNDVCLNGGSTITAMTGGLQLSLNNPGQKNAQIMVDGYNGGALEEYAHIVEYAQSADFKGEDADLFCYWPNNWQTNKLQVMPSSKEDGSLIDPLILRDPDNMKKRTLEFYKNDGSVDAFGNPFKVEAQAQVGDLFTDFPSAKSEPPFARDGYYIAGWARDPNAYEEDFAAYYNSTDGKWYMNYDLATGQWTSQADVPTYTVDEKYDQRFYAIWKPYVVRYNLNNADPSIEPLEDGIGPKVQIMGPAQTSFVREGVTYSFRGWSLTENAAASDPDYAVGREIQLTDHDVTLYAVWRPSVVKFTFDFNGGGDKEGRTQAVVTVTRGEPLTIPYFNITRTGKAFGGWSEVKDGTADYQVGEKIVTADDTEDLTLYAVWKDIYTVTFHLTGGQILGNPDNWVQTVAQGDGISLNDVKPSRVGYRFTGWAETEGGTVKYGPELASMTPESNLNLYAVWVEQYWTVSFDLNGGVGAFAPVPVRDGTDFTIPEEEPAWTDGSFQFRGWTVSKDGTGTPLYAGSSVAITQDTTLHAVWKESAVIRFYVNTNVWKTIDAAEGDMFTITVPDPAMDGNKFLYWARDGHGEEQYKRGDAFTVEGAERFAARFEPISDSEWVLTFDLDREGADWTESVQMVADKGSAITIPTAKPTSAQVFSHWYDSANPGAVYHPGDFVRSTENKTLKASWVDAVTVTYDLQGGTGNFGTAIAGNGIGYALPSESPAKQGYEFLGWSTNSAGSGPLLRPGQEHIFTGDATLYAVWKEATWTVKFDLNGASGEMPVQTVRRGESFQLPVPSQRSHYQFLGWAESADERDPAKLYMDAYTPSADITLYAIWEQEIWKVTFNLDGGTLAAHASPYQAVQDNSPDAVVYDVAGGENVMITPPIIERTDEYFCDGWSDGTKKYPYESQIPLTGSITLSPIWEKQTIGPTPVAPTAQEDPAKNEAPAQPETEAAAALTEAASAATKEKAVWEVAFYLDGVDFVKHPELSGKELKDCQWDEDEQWLIYTVPAGEDGMILPPEIELDGWILDGWLLLGEEEDEEIVYPAGEEIPVTESMYLIPVWKEPEPAPAFAQTAPDDPLSTEAATPPETEAATQSAEEAAPPPTTGEETAAPQEETPAP